MKDYSNEWVIQRNSQRINLINTINLVLKFNEEFNYENENENEDNENENKDNEKKKENENEKSRIESENEKEENEKLRREYENEKNEKKEMIKILNNDLDEIIDKSKLFEDQIKSIRKVKNLNQYYDKDDYDNKELKSKYFKIKLPDMSNIINEKLFQKIFGHTLIKLADKLINLTNKEENQIIVKNIEKNIGKLHKMHYYEWADLYDAANLILDFNGRY